MPAVCERVSVKLMHRRLTLLLVMLGRVRLGAACRPESLHLNLTVRNV